MNFFIKILGSAFLLVAVLAMTREYEMFLKKRFDVCRGFIELLSHIRRKIDGYLTPATELLDGFECKALTETGYVDRAREKGISSAYFELEGSLHLDAAVQSCLSSFFSDFGKDYKEGTLKLLDLSIGRLSEYTERLSAENERSLKLARTLAAAVALGLIILII